MISGLIVLAIGGLGIFFEATSGLISGIIPISPIIIYVVCGILVVIGLGRVIANLKWFSKGY